VYATLQVFISVLFFSLQGKVQPLEVLPEGTFKRKTTNLLLPALKMEISYLPSPACKKASLCPHFCTDWITWNSLL